MLQKVNLHLDLINKLLQLVAKANGLDGDNVRFRYGTPEKIGGWAQLGSVDITGRNTAIHHFINTSGIKYAALRNKQNFICLLRWYFL